jgi:hypothetical protein
MYVCMYVCTNKHNLHAIGYNLECIHWCSIQIIAVYNAHNSNSLLKASEIDIIIINLTIENRPTTIIKGKKL